MRALMPLSVRHSVTAHAVDRAPPPQEGNTRLLRVADDPGGGHDQFEHEGDTDPDAGTRR